MKLGMLKHSWLVLGACVALSGFSAACGDDDDGDSHTAGGEGGGSAGKAGGGAGKAGGGAGKAGGGAGKAGGGAGKAGGGAGTSSEVEDGGVDDAG